VTAASQYGVVFCGGGPAATGVVLCAAAEGRLVDLLSQGVCIVEQDSAIGPGGLVHYPISANTRGGSFLRCLEALPSEAGLGSARADPSTDDLARLRHVFPRLPLVGRHLENVGRAVHAAVASAAGCAVLTEHTVQDVQLLASGGVAVSSMPAKGSPPVTVVSERAVIAMGGTPRTRLEDLSLLPGLDLATCADRLCHAVALLDDRSELPPHLRRSVVDAGEAVVVGGSHSAWSAAWMLVHDPRLRSADGRPPRVTVLHRSPLRFFFRDVARARAAGYAFDEVRDVCPRTGMVNRHGGLRADAHALAWAATHQERGEGPVRAVALVDEPESRAAARRALDGAGAVIAGIGYEPNVPSLRRPDGSPLRLATSETGALVTDQARLVTTEGTVLPELLAFGLGAGLPATGELAGEPSYAGRLDAVSLYQAEVGRIVLETLLGSAHS